MRYGGYRAAGLMLVAVACGGHVGTSPGSQDAGSDATTIDASGVDAPGDDGSVSDAASDASAGDGGTPAATPPPSPRSPQTATPTEEHNFALHTIDFGDTDRNGVPSAQAWKNFGYDLDGKCTTAASTDVCTPQPGGPETVHDDGTACIDNAFGHLVLPILMAVSSSFSQSANNAINAGAFTDMLDVFGLSDAALATQTAVGLNANLLLGSQFSATAQPSWTKADNWPIDPSSLTNTSDPRSAQIKISGAYVVNGEFVASGVPALPVTIVLGGAQLDLVVHAAIVTFDHSVAGRATSGTIAGVLDSTEFIVDLQKVAGRIATSLCTGSEFESLAAQIQEASDLVYTGGTISNPAGTQCNAISIGLGFDADEIAPPATVAPPTTPSPDPCGG